MRRGDYLACPRCGIERYVRRDQGSVYCRDCPPTKRWDAPLAESDLGPIRWVRDGLVWRAVPVENPLETRGLPGNVWENEGTRKDGPGRCANTVIPGPCRLQGVD